MTKTRPSFSVRPAVIEDLDQIVGIERDQAKARNITAWSREKFQSEFSSSKSKILVVTDDETDELVIGFLVYRLSPDFSEILSIATHREFRGLGWAQRLILEAIKDSMRHNLKKVFLEVRKSNEPALKLYQKMRFDIIRVRKGYYTGNPLDPQQQTEDAYEMELDLTNSGVSLSG